MLRLPADAAGICDGKMRGGANSFGWSGIIAHGMFVRPTHAVSRLPSTPSSTWASVYRTCARRVRREQAGPTSRALRVCLLSSNSDLGSAGLGPDETMVTGTLKTPVAAVFSQHVINDAILLPGVTYIEMASAYSRVT